MQLSDYQIVAFLFLVETQGLEPWSELGNCRTFYMFSCYLFSSDSRLASDLSSTLETYILITDKFPTYNRLCRVGTPNSPAAKVSQSGMWRMVNLLRN